MDASGTAVEGRSFPAGEAPFVHLRGVRENYFQVLRVPILEGRHFSTADSETGPKVAIINATMARQLWPNESAVGKRIRPDALQEGGWLTIIGVVTDIKNENLVQRPRPEIYYPYAQYPTRGVSMMLRTSVASPALAGTLREQIWNVDSTLAVTDVRSMEQVKMDSFRGTTFQSLLLGSFAGLALLLSATGIYSVLSYSTSQRSREIGIRMALGARGANVLAMILRGGLKVLLVGVGIGMAAAFLLTRFIRTLLFGVGATDPATLLIAGLMVILVGLTACFFPSRRAARLNPMVALRSE
jgi:predicted permease